MAWIYLLIAGLLEIAWATGLKYTKGFTQPVATAVTVVLMIASFVFLAQAVKVLPLGTGYAIWTGIGVVGTTVLGIWLFNEPAHWLRFGCILLILVGIVGLKLTAGANQGT